MAREQVARVEDETHDDNSLDEARVEGPITRVVTRTVW